MRLTNNMIQEDNEKWVNRDVLTELEICGRRIPDWNKTTAEDNRYTAWVCREALRIIKSLPENLQEAIKENERLKRQNENLRIKIKAVHDAVVELDSEVCL